ALVVHNNALIVQDGLGYDWSYIAQGEPTEFALMAYTSGSNTEGNPRQALKYKGMFDSGCPRHTTGNKALLTDYQDIDGELKFNLFFVLQMRDKKNSVLFTESECLALSPDFKLIDESQLSPAKPAQAMSHTTESMAPIIEDWVSDSEDESDPNDPQIFTKSKPVSVTAARPLSAAVPKIMAAKPRHVCSLHTKTNSIIRRHQTPNKFLKTSNSSLKVTAAHAKMVSATKGKKGNGPTANKASASISKSELSVIKTSNISVEMPKVDSVMTNIDGGFVAFGGSTKGGIGKIRTNKIDFKDVFFVKELKFNLFSVSQMCDKKNSVLFTESECLVLCLDFKLIDESQVLLRVPRQNNMYSFDLKNVVPSGDLTCLFEKATIDESNLWHRRLGHVNFKTMNKLVKGNLVRGLPSKTFEDDHTCVACQKGKQHKASWNQANKNAGHQEVNGDTDDKARDNTADDAAGKEKVQEPVSEYDQALNNAYDEDDLETNNHSYDDESVGAEADFNNMEPSTVVSHIPTTRVHYNYPRAQIIRDPMSAVQTRGTIKKSSREHAMISYIQKKKRTNYKDFQNCLFACFLSQHKPAKITQALNDESWVEAMQERLLQFKIQKVWTLVDLPYGKKAIGIDYDEVFALVARVEAIRLFSAFASYMNFLVYQMDVKSAFLYGTIEEEVYVSQPPGFVDPKFLEKVYKVEKALYGLHQAPIAWYETLSTYMLDNGFHRGQIDKTLFIKRLKGDILLVQV
nr:hypothetical protein [Tanacetum cinerariifolium]